MTICCMRRLFTASVLTLLFLMILSGCAKKKEATKEEPVPVTVAIVVKKNVPLRLETIGNVEAYSTVVIGSRVGGQLMKVHFVEGQFVKKGDVLFTVDEEPYRIQVRQTEAALARDISQAKYAGDQERRSAELVKKGYISQEEYEQARTNFASLESAIKADRATLDGARLQLGYCVITAPIGGRTGNLLLHEGNLIKANDDKALVVITQVQPVRVTFAVPEQYCSRLRNAMRGRGLPVEAVVTGNEKTSVSGTVTFVDNAVNTATGTIQVKGTFSNKDNLLWPGQFVTCDLTLETRAGALVVPAAAVQTANEGTYVFVVKSDAGVEKRPVKTLPVSEDETIVETGLAEGEIVVTDGQLRLVPGAKVEKKTS